MHDSDLLTPSTSADLSHLSDRALLSGIRALLGTERRAMTQLVAYLAEVDERRLYLAAACPSLFDFCRSRLGLSEGESFRRIAGARLVRRFPNILGLLERGEIHLTALGLLREHLTEENHVELLRAASRKSKIELQELLAARFPKADVVASIRALPTATGDERKSSVATGLGLFGPAGPSRGRSVAAPTAQSTHGPSRMDPLSAERYKVQFTAGKEVRDKLERATLLMSHQNPRADLAVVVERALDLLIANLEKTRLGKAMRPRKSKPAKAGHVTRAARRAVFARDGERCSFVSETGDRCV
ncbi:MAG: hypothetical protein K0S65_2481, partial [Labilithrix sp.]|nr:hypothetical protein [Labilithrix sp.]